MKTPLLSLQQVGLTRQHNVILSDISFSLHDNEAITIVGPNGAGKSSLLALALGLSAPSTGKVIRHRPLRIGFVPQFIHRDESLPMTVIDFVKLTKTPFTRDEMRVLFDELDIAHLSHTMLSHLSGGELRRVLLARALLNQPDILMLDEPTAGVDVTGQVAFYQRLNAWRAHRQFALLMVSHDLHLVMSSTDHVICLNKHICCQGVPDSVLKHEHYLALFGDATIANASPASGLAFYHHKAHQPGHNDGDNSNTRNGDVRDSANTHYSQSTVKAL